MTTYHATMMHAVRGGEGHYTFEGDPDLFRHTPVRIMRKFMESLQADGTLDYVDYEINAAYKNDAAQTVATLGEITFTPDNVQPFVCMISPKG